MSTSSQSTPHLQGAVHFNEDFLHLQHPLHPFSGLHPQQMKWTYSGSLRNCNPIDGKSSISFLMSTPCIWIRKILLCNKGLSPTNCLVYSTFCVLKESIMRWLPAIYLLLQITLFDNHWQIPGDLIDRIKEWRIFQ